MSRFYIRGDRGMALSITQSFILLISIGFLVVLIGVVLGKFFETRTIVDSSDTEHHAILIGNLFLSSDKLSVTDGNNIQRAVLDKTKLDKELNKGDSKGLFGNTKSSELLKEIGYPKSTIFLKVNDLESGNSWFQGEEKGENSANKIFPIAIKDGDFVHVGIMSITLVE